MKFGLAVPVEKSELVRGAGFEFIEETAEHLFGANPDPQPDFPVLAASHLLPETMKITGESVALPSIRQYIQHLCERAEQLGVRTLIFDAGVARSVPEGFDPKQAKRQILDFLRTTLPFCARHGIMLVCQPLESAASNIINTLPDAMQYVWEIDHPNFQLLIDGEPLAKGADSLENVRDALPWVRHVHLPALSHDARPLFAELKRGKYDDLITLRTANFGVPPQDVLELLRNQWIEA